MKMPLTIAIVLFIVFVAVMCISVAIRIQDLRMKQQV